MRKPFGNDRYDYVFSFFTSFGYFKDETENQRVIRNMTNALKPGSILVFDYINAHYAAEHLVPSEEKEIDGIIYNINRWTNETHFFKKIRIDNIAMAEPVEHIERVKKFSVDDFQNLFTANGLQLEKVYGDYYLNEYDPENSPRLILIAKKIKS